MPKPPRWALEPLQSPSRGDHAHVLALLLALDVVTVRGVPALATRPRPAVALDVALHLQRFLPAGAVAVTWVGYRAVAAHSALVLEDSAEAFALGPFAATAAAQRRAQLLCTADDRCATQALEALSRGAPPAGVNLSSPVPRGREEWDRLGDEPHPSLVALGAGTVAHGPASDPSITGVHDASDDDGRPLFALGLSRISSLTVRGSTKTLTMCALAAVAAALPSLRTVAFDRTVTLAVPKPAAHPRAATLREVYREDLVKGVLCELPLLTALRLPAQVPVDDRLLHSIAVAVPSLKALHVPVAFDISRQAWHTGPRLVSVP